MSDHDRNLATAFDGQAAHFERAPIQSDPAGLERLVRFAAFPAGCLVLDAGCGPGLVSAALLQAGYRVQGVDLSAEMVARARSRCAGFGDRAHFEQCSVFDQRLTGPFDGVVSRFVLHHMVDHAVFIRRQAELLQPAGIIVVSDHTTDADPVLAVRHQEVEQARDSTHTANATPGQLVDLLAAAGLSDLRLVEEAFEFDFDGWFDRGTPRESKAIVRARLLAAPAGRGFTPTLLPDGSIRVGCHLGLVRGVKG